ncbi:MAG: hypothetical protein ACHQ6U_11650 [Thermodesulfobacteriota bacterium]
MKHGAEIFAINEALKVMGKVKVVGAPIDKPGEYDWDRVLNKNGIKH